MRGRYIAHVTRNALTVILDLASACIVLLPLVALTFRPLWRTSRKACFLLLSIWDRAHLSFSSSNAPELRWQSMPAFQASLTYARRRARESLDSQSRVSCIFLHPIALWECQLHARLSWFGSRVPLPLPARPSGPSRTASRRWCSGVSTARRSRSCSANPKTPLGMAHETSCPSRCRRRS